MAHPTTPLHAVLPCIPGAGGIRRRACRGWHRGAAALVTALAAMAAGAGAVTERVQKKGVLVIAHRESSVPFSYLDDQGEPTGYAVELCLRLAQALKARLGMSGLKIEYRAVNSANRIETIAQGLADLECGSTTNNAERRQSVGFTVPHYITGARLLVRADSPLRELGQFAGHRLVSTQGSTPLKAVDRANRDQLLGIQIVAAPDHARAVQMVENGEADGFAMDDVLLFGLISSRPNPGKLKVVGKFLTIEPLAIMLDKDDALFKRMVDDEMKRLIATREAHRLYERWFMRPIPPRQMALNLPMNHLLKDFWKYPSDQVPN